MVALFAGGKKLAGQTMAKGEQTPVKRYHPMANRKQ